MTKTPDMTAMLKDVMGAFPVDTAAMEDAFKSSATLNEKLSGVALTAAE
ncbi:MAG: phasin, PhaP, partial [Sulfitobacter sp.]